MHINAIKDILQHTKKLSDGSYEKIFMQSLSNAGIFVFSCILCNIEMLPNQAAFLAHIFDKQHVHNSNYLFKPNATYFRSQMSAFRGCKLPFKLNDLALNLSLIYYFIPIYS